MNASEHDWSRLQNVLLLLLFLCFCLYLPTLFHYAFADDEVYLAYANHFLRESNWTELYQLFLKQANPWEFLPLRDLTYWLDFRLYGDELGGFHATNLLWYAASALASFWLFRELILLCKPAWADRATILSLCGTLIFAVHPAHVEVTAWIASRKDLLAGTFGFLSIAFFVRAVRCDWLPRDVLLAALMLFLACFSKAAAMTNILLIVVLSGIGWRSSQEVFSEKKIGYLSVFLGLIAFFFLIHLKIGEASGIRIDNAPGLLAVIERASRIFSSLIGILLFPYPLHLYHDVYQFGEWHWLVTASAASLFVVSLWVLLKNRSLWAFGVVLAISPLFIYLQLMPFTTWSLASERFVFTSVAGLALVLIDLFGRLASPEKIGVLLILIVFPSALIVWSRVGDWEYGNRLLDREYEFQPNFHNAIRDRIIFKLIPEKRYVEADTLARQLPRSWAAKALLSSIVVEQVFQQMSAANDSMAADGKKAIRLEFCNSVLKLRLAIQYGYEKMPSEPDVSYNNILRTLEKQLKLRFADSRPICINL